MEAINPRRAMVLSVRYGAKLGQEIIIESHWETGRNFIFKEISMGKREGIYLEEGIDFRFITNNSNLEKEIYELQTMGYR